ncbi:MAG: hypothetical protein QXE77_02280 [Desulfurococcaceae archaeon]
MIIYVKVVAIVKLAGKIIDVLRRNWPIILANAVSLYLSVSHWNPYDVRYFIMWYDKYFSQGRLLEVYTGPPEEKVAYFPLAVIIFTLFHTLAVTLSNDIFVWRLIDKIPLLVSFNLVYFLLVKRYGKPAGYLWLITFVSYSVIMGYQFDLIIVLFILLAILSLEKKNYEVYALWISLATLIKQVLVVLLLVPFVELVKKKNIRGIAKYLCVSGITLAVFVIPFLMVDPWSFIAKTFFFHAKRLPQFSIWAVPYYLSGFNPDVIPLWVYDLWVFTYAAFLAWVTYRMFVEKNFTYIKFLKYMNIVVAGFLIFTKVNNVPYILWMAPSIIAIVFSNENENNENRVILKKIASVYIFSNIIVILTSISLTFPSMVVGYPIYIAEDQNWIPADKFIVDSGGPYSIVNLALYLRPILPVREFFTILADVSHYLVAVLCIVHVMLLLYIVIKLIRYF